MKPGKRKLISPETKQQIADFVNLHKGVFTAAYLATMFGMSPTTISRICKELGLEIKRHTCGKYGGRAKDKKEVGKSGNFSFKDYPNGLI